MKNKILIFFCFILNFSLLTKAAVTVKTTTKVPFVNISKGKLLWSDEFNYDGPPDPKNWYIQSNTVNNYYKLSNAWRDENAYVSNGNITLIGKKEYY